MNHFVAGIAGAGILLAQLFPARAQAYALSLMDQPTPGTPIGFEDFETRPLSPPLDAGQAAPLVQCLDGHQSVDGSQALVGTASATADTIFYISPPGLFQTAHRYRVSLDFRVLQAPAGDGMGCLLLREKHAWSPTRLRRAPGPVNHVAYEFVADYPDSNFQIGLGGPGQIAIDNLRFEELPPLAAASDSTNAPAGAEPLRTHVGICAHLGWLYFYKTDDDVRRGLDRIQELGTTWIRISITWATLFPNPDGQPEPAILRRTDLIVDEALKRHLRILCILGATPAWAAGPLAPGEVAWKMPAAVPADYEHYVRFVAERYRGKIGAWEIYNEPNGAFWDAPFADYLAELHAAGGLLHQIDPHNTVVSAGLVEAGLLDVKGARRQPYLDLLRPEIAKDYDAFGLHSYADYSSTLYMLNVIGERMKANGTQKPIWITETGFTVAGKSTELQQARVLPERIKMLLRDPLVENVFIYNLRMKTFDQNAREAGFGLIRGDFSPRPAFETVKSLLQSAVVQKDPALTAVDGL